MRLRSEYVYKQTERTSKNATNRNERVRARTTEYRGRYVKLCLVFYGRGTGCLYSAPRFSSCLIFLPLTDRCASFLLADCDTIRLSPDGMVHETLFVHAHSQQKMYEIPDTAISLSLLPSLYIFLVRCSGCDTANATPRNYNVMAFVRICVYEQIKQRTCSSVFFVRGALF